MSRGLGDVYKRQVLYSGETWVSRGLVKSLHTQMTFAGDDTLFPHPDGHSPVKN